LKKKAIGEETNVRVVFEKVAEDLLMVSLTNQIQFRSILSYWRLVKVSGIPPLEIGIDCESQSLASIVFFIDSTFLEQCGITEIEGKKGSVLVDTSVFSKANDYIDIDEEYAVCIKDNKMICLFNEGNMANQSYRTDRLEIYLDAMYNIVGFAICDLSIQERNILKSL